MADSSVSGPAPSSSVLKRRKLYDDSELVGLFELFDRLPPGDERATLSVIARDRLRSLFPRGQDQTGLAELANGLNIEVDLGDLFGAEFYVGHCNEAAVVSALCKTLPHGARVVDVGANFGLYALHAVRYAGKLSRAVAFEPAPRTFGLLQANIKRNRLSTRIKARRAAVSDAPGVVSFYVATDQSFSGLRDTCRSPPREVVDVEQVSLDTDPAVIALGPVDFLKIDTEGGEAGVLAGAAKTIARSPGLVALMEYSFKNLTAQQAVDVRKGVDDLLTKGLRSWTIDLNNEATPLKSAAQMPANFNGSLLLAAPEAQWVDAFLAALAEAAAPAAADTALAWSAAAGLLRIVRQGQEEITTLERWSAKAGLPEGEVLGERVVKHIERLQADAKSLSARLEQAEATAKRDQERDAQRQESERLKLKQEEVTWYSARLEQQRRETDAMRALAEQRDTEVAAMHEKVASLRVFMNKLSDQLQAKSEDVIRLMGRREADAAARGEVEAQWIKSMDALRARLDAISGELTTARAEKEQIEQKRWALRGHVDALNVKLEQVAALRDADAAEHMRRIAEREEALDAAQVQRALLQDLFDVQTKKLDQALASRAADLLTHQQRLEEHESALKAAQANVDQALASRAADLLTYQQQLEEQESALKAAHAKQVDQQRTIASLNERYEQASSTWAAVFASHSHQLSQSEDALRVVRAEHASLLSTIDDLNAKLAQVAQERASESSAYQSAHRQREVELRAQLEAQFAPAIDQYKARTADLEAATRGSQQLILALKSALEAANDRAEGLARDEAATRESLGVKELALDAMTLVRVDLERQIQGMGAELDERRVQIRTLQQQLALRQLGRTS